MVDIQISEITVKDTNEMLASAPALLGFHPADSLLIFGLRSNELRVLTRADLPSTLNQAVDAILSAFPPLLQHSIRDIAFAVVSNSGWESFYHKAIRQCLPSLTAAEITITNKLWIPTMTADSRWHDITSADAHGVLPDPYTTRAAALRAVEGRVIYPRRDDLVALLNPVDHETLARRAMQLNRHVPPIEQAESAPTTVAHARLAQIRTAIETSTHADVYTDTDILNLATALADHRVRDACLNLGDQYAPAAIEHLWTMLTRSTPPPHRAEPACMLSYQAYIRGDTAFAGIALANARAADSNHRLTHLFQGALAIAADPAKIATAGAQAAKRVFETHPNDLHTTEST